MSIPARQSPSRNLARMLALDDFEGAARRALPRPVFAYVAGGAEQNLAFDDNRRAFRELALVPQVLRNVSQRSQQVSLLGRSYAAPFGIAPMGLLALTTYRGDIVLARAAHVAHIPTVISGTSLVRLEEIAEAAPSSWFQAYLPGEPQRINALLERVAAAGIKTLVLTVDCPVGGNRENNARAGFSTPLKPSLRLAFDGMGGGAASSRAARAVCGSRDGARDGARADLGVAGSTRPAWAYFSSLNTITVPPCGTAFGLPTSASMPLCMRCASTPQPDSTATYCSPFTSNDVGTPVTPDGVAVSHST